MCAHCYKVAGEATRHRILSFLKSDPMSVGALAGRLKLRQPTVTHHLHRLAAVGLVVGERAGRERRYRLKRESECFVECGLLKGI